MRHASGTAREREGWSREAERQLGAGRLLGVDDDGLETLEGGDLDVGGVGVQLLLRVLVVVALAWRVALVREKSGEGLEES